jgi:branched-chain amino acid transport system substrate-binding protein
VASLIDRRRLLAGGAAAGLGLAARPAQAAFGDTSLAATVTIGVVAPFTGDAIRLGEQIGDGVRGAVDAANQARGALDKIYQVRTFDDQNALATGIVAAQFACDDASVVAVIGHLSGRITDAALQTYVNNRMPLLVPVSTYDRITAHGYGGIVRLTVKDSTEGHLAARYVNGSVKPKSVAVLYQDGDYGVDVASGFADQMGGDKVTCKVVGFSWSKPDFAAAAQAAVAATPDAVYLAGLVKDMGGIIPALHDAGYNGPFFASQGFFDSATIAKYQTLVEGLTISTSMPPLQFAPTAYRYLVDYQQHYGAMTPLAAFAFAAAQVVIAIVRRTGATDRIALGRSLTFGTAYDTVVGTLAFQSDGDPQDPDIYLYAVKNGAWKYVQAAHPSAFVVKVR